MEKFLIGTDKKGVPSFESVMKLVEKVTGREPTAEDVAAAKLLYEQLPKTAEEDQP